MNNKNEKASTYVSVLWPSVGSVYGFGWERMKKFFLDLFHTPGGVLLRIFSLAYWLLLFAPIDYGSAFVFLKSAKGEKFEVKDMFLSFENYLNVVLAKLLVTAVITLGLFLLIVPGIIFACKLAFVKYLVLERKMELEDDRRACP